MTNKPFDRDLFDRNDRKARDAVMKFLLNEEHFVTENTDLYGPDLILQTSFGGRYYIEVEVKQIWKPLQPVFPFNRVQLPGRKKKFLNLGLPIEFWVLRSDLKFALIITEESMLEERLIEVPNKYQHSGELFYSIPTEECSLVEIDVWDDIWNKE